MTRRMLVLLAHGPARFDRWLTMGALIALMTLVACSEPRKLAGPSGAGNEPAISGAPSSATNANPSGATGAQLGATTTADAAVAPLAPGEFPASTRANLQWKRYAAFEADLSSALGLPKDKLCAELGRENCIRAVHLTPLGGHDPFATGLLEPSAEPLATTPTVVERIVLSACSARIALDLASKSSEVFGGLDLSAPAPAPSEPVSRALVSALYRRFLARDADEQELTTLTQLTRDEQGQAVSGRDYALSACLVVGTNSEFLFF